VLNLPDGHDPDSYLKAYGSEAFLQYVQTHEHDFVSFKTTILLEDAGRDPFKRAEVASEVVRTISLMPDRMKQDVLLREAARLLAVSEDTLRAEATRMENARARERDRQADRDKRRNPTKPSAPALELPPGILPPPKEAQTTDLRPPDYDDWDPFAHAEADAVASQTLAPRSKSAAPEELGGLLDAMSAADQLALQEREAIRLLLNHGSRALEQGTLVEYIFHELEGIEFTSEPAASALRAIQHLQSLGIAPGPEHLLTHQDAEIRSFAQELVMPRHFTSPGWEKKTVKIEEFGAYLQRLAFRHLCYLNLRSINLKIEALKEEIHHTDDTLAEQAMQKYLELKGIELLISKEIGMVVKNPLASWG
jgi:DNA primase